MNKIKLREEVSYFKVDDKILLGEGTPNRLILNASDPLLSQLFNNLDGELSEDEIMSLFNEEFPDRVQELSQVLRRLHHCNLIYSVSDEDFGDSPFDRMLRYFQVENMNSAVFTKHSLLARLQDARILIVGAGGIGSEVAVSLAMCGIAHLTLVDNDVVTTSNQNRSRIFSFSQNGLLKVEILKRHIESEYPWCKVLAIPHLVKDNEDLLGQLDGSFDCVVSAIDNPIGIHLTISDSCVKHQVPMIRGGYGSHLGAIDSMYIPFASSCFRCQDRVAHLTESSDVHVTRLFSDKFIAPSATWVTAVLSGFMTEQIMALITRSLPLALVNARLSVNFSDLSSTRTSFEPPTSCECCGGTGV